MEKRVTYGYLPRAAPTAPKPPLLSMMLASHSTVPVSVRFEPRPALVRLLFCGRKEEMI